MSDRLDDVLNEEIELRNKENKKKKTLIIRISAAALAVVGLFSAVIFPFGKKKNENKNNDITTTTVATTTTTSNKNVNLSDLGKELEIPTKPTNKIVDVISGDIDPNEVVEKDGKLYANSEEAEQAGNTNSTSINLQNGTLVTDSNGKVYNKTTGYVIIDGETKETIATGNINNSGIPDGYAYDSVLNKYLPKEEVGKYTYSDATYYDSEGNIALQKNDIVLKTDLDLAKKYFTTVKPTTKSGNTVTVTTTTSQPTQTTKSTTVTTKSTTVFTTTTTKNQGVVNEDGTYTIYGTTYMDKATFEAFIIDENSADNFGFYNGIVYPMSVLKEITNNKEKIK